MGERIGTRSGRGMPEEHVGCNGVTFAALAEHNSFTTSTVNTTTAGAAYAHTIANVGTNTAAGSVTDAGASTRSCGDVYITVPGKNHSGRVHNGELCRRSAARRAKGRCALGGC